MEAEYTIWLNRSIADPREVLGIPLQPITLGHLMWLDRVDAYPALTPEQVITAALICSRNEDDIEQTLTDPWLEWKLRFWFFRYKGFGEIDWVEEATKFADYYDESTESPSVMHQTESKGGSSGTPFIQHLKATLQARLNYTHQEALDTPYHQAIWDYYSYHEIEGSIEVLDRKKRQEIQELADSQHLDTLKEAQRLMREGL